MQKTITKTWQRIHYQIFFKEVAADMVIFEMGNILNVRNENIYFKLQIIIPKCHMLGSNILFFCSSQTLLFAIFPISIAIYFSEVTTDDCTVWFGS